MSVRSVCGHWAAGVPILYGDANCDHGDADGIARDPSRIPVGLGVAIGNRDPGWRIVRALQELVCVHPRIRTPYLKQSQTHVTHYH
jgi:hypothetical protein